MVPQEQVSSLIVHCTLQSLTAYGADMSEKQWLQPVKREERGGGGGFSKSVSPSHLGALLPPRDLNSPASILLPEPRESKKSAMYRRMARQPGSRYLTCTYTACHGEREILPIMMTCTLSLMPRRTDSEHPTPPTACSTGAAKALQILGESHQYKPGMIHWLHRHSFCRTDKSQLTVIICKDFTLNIQWSSPLRVGWCPKGGGGCSQCPGKSVRLSPSASLFPVNQSKTARSRLL